MLELKTQLQRSYLGAFVLLFALSTAAVAAGPTMEYEGKLTSEPRLERPTAVTYCPEDLSLCVTDEASNSLEVFDQRGAHQFSTDSMSGISTPRAASLDARGEFVFTNSRDSVGRTIKRLNFLGEPVPFAPERPTEDWAPVHLIITRDGYYVSLDGSGLLTKHDADTGALKWSLPLVDPDSDRADLMGRPAEAPNGHIYVPSSGYHGVRVVSEDGREVASFGTRGGKRGEVSFPVGVSFGPDGQVFVLDRMRHRILVFSSDHEFVTEFGRLGEAPGDLFHPMAIASAPDGRVWIAQGYQGRVQVFRYQDDES